MRIIVDTNVFVSGIFWDGPPHQILQAWKRKEIHIILSKAILEEYIRVFEKLKEKYPPIDLTFMAELLTIHAEFCNAVHLHEKITRDPNDDMFFAVALGSDVKIIVSGDRDLLDVSPYKKIKVITPKEFVKQYLKK